MAKLLIVIGIFTLTLASGIRAWAQEQERILVVLNIDSKADIHPDDWRSDAKVFETLRSILEQQNQNVKLKSVLITNLREMKAVILQSSEPIRGIVFLGHGNEYKYALSKNQVFSGDGEFATTIADILNQSRVSKKIVLYFTGCLMASTKSVRPNFQTTLFQTVSEKLNSDRRERLEVIAHMDPVISNRASLAKPNVIDRLFYKFKMGAWLQQINLMAMNRIGSLGSPLVSTTILAAGIAASVMIPDLGFSPFLLAAGLVVVKNVSASAAGLYGQSLTSDGIRSGSAYDLMSGAISCEQSLSP